MLMSQDEVTRIRYLLSARKARRVNDLASEMMRLTSVAAAMGVQQVIVFGSMAREQPGPDSDLDLLIVWDTPLDFLARTAALYRQFQPQVPVDLLVYTPDEMTRMVELPFIQKILESGKVLYEA